MNLQELRSTLGEIADGLEDTPSARVAPVHGRIARARRRRTAAVTGAAVAAVVLVGAVAVPPLLTQRDARPVGHDAPSRLAGREVPRTQQATGFTYRYARGYQSSPGARRLDVVVPGSDTPQLVMWASSDTTRALVVRLSNRTIDGDAEVSPATGFGRYTVLPPAGDGKGQRLRLTQRNAGDRTRLAVAVYRLGDPTSAGTGNRSTVFRDQVAGQPLVKGVVGKPGRTDLRFRVRVPDASLRWASTCSGSSRWYTVSVGGRELIGSRCHRRPELDPGVDGAVFDGGPGGLRLTPGRTVEVRMHLSPDSRHTGTVSTDARAVLGLGLYAQEGPSHRVLGADLLDHSESDGHDWLAGRWLESRPGSTSLRLHLPAADRPRLLTWVADEAPGGGSRVVFKLSHGDGARGTIDEQDMSTVGGRSSGSGYVVQPGRPADVLLAVPHGTNRTRLALVVSDQLE